MKEEIKIIKINQRDSFLSVIIEYKGEKYEGLLLKSGYKKDWEKEHIMKLDKDEEDRNH